MSAAAAAETDLAGWMAPELRSRQVLIGY